MKKTVAVWLTVFGVGLLGGCHQVTGPVASSSQAHSARVAKTKPAKSSAAAAKASAPAKESVATPATIAARLQPKLATFMASWQQEMGQSFQGTYSQASVDYLGYVFPKVLAGQRFAAYVNEENVSLTWYQGGGSGRFVVYAAAVGGRPHAMYPMLYLFAVDRTTGQPTVLYSGTTNGDALYFQPTANTALANGFAAAYRQAKTAAAD